MTEYAVMAETHEGNVFLLRRGFLSMQAAEDHPVRLSLWKRVWIEPYVRPIVPAPSLTAPTPWTVERYGNKFTYLRDADNMRVASLHGVVGRREAIEEMLRAAGFFRAPVRASGRPE